MLYTAIDIAKYIVSYCSNKKQPISNLDICAWQLGPVIPDVYYEFCSYAGTPIFESFDVSIDSNDIKTINSIIDSYISVPASALVNRSHKKGGAWDIVYQDGIGNRNIIPFSLIREKECGC